MSDSVLIAEQVESRVGRAMLRGLRAERLDVAEAAS